MNDIRDMEAEAANDRLSSTRQTYGLVDLSAGHGNAVIQQIHSAIFSTVRTISFVSIACRRYD